MEKRFTNQILSICITSTPDIYLLKTQIYLKLISMLKMLICGLEIESHLVFSVFLTIKCVYALYIRVFYIVLNAQT